MTNKDQNTVPVPQKFKRTYLKVYRGSGTFTDSRKNDITYIYYYTLFDDDKVRLDSDGIRYSMIFPFFHNFIEFFSETDNVTGEVRDFYKLYVEKVDKKDFDGKTVLDDKGNVVKTTVYYILVNGKKAYIPSTCISHKDSADKARKWSFELQFKAAPKFEEEYFSALENFSDLQSVDDDNIPF